jgi:RHS repeat-associated protein
LLATTKAAASGEYQYATADHLGSPRAWTDQSGNLIAGGRHDYAPFGEELSAGIGIRSASNGYGDDSVRQKFTSKERDSETGLDFFGARYFAGAQGRFTSVDSLMSSAHIIEPQSWNRYAYTLNNPLRFVDVKGLYVWGADAGGNDTDEELRRKRDDKTLSRSQRNVARDALSFRERFRAGLERAMNTASALPEGAEKDQALRGVYAYGNEGSANSMTVTVGNLPNDVSGQVSADPNQPLSYDQATDTFTANVIVTFNRDTRGDSLAIATGHEGSHVADRRDFAGAAHAGNDALNGPFNLSRYQTEFRAYTVSSIMAQALGLPNLSQGRHEIWNSRWSAAERATLRANGINEHLRTSPNYQVTPQNQGPSLYPR